MARNISPARTSAIATLVALSVVLVTASNAVAQGDIALQDVISPQYQAPGADAVEAALEAVTAPAEALAPQYHPNDASDNSALVTENAPAPASPLPEPPAPPVTEPAAAEPEPPAPPAAEPEPSPEPPAPPAPDLGTVMPDVEVAVPGIDDAVPRIEDPAPDLDAVAPDAGAAAPPPVSAPAGGGNINIAIRINSPGDDGPVAQVGGARRGAPTATGATPPGTWIWNWTWTGASDCLSAPPGNIAPPGAGDWTWTWTWSCDGAPAPVPGVELPPGIELPAAGGLPTLVPAAALAPAEALDAVAPGSSAKARAFPQSRAATPPPTPPLALPARAIGSTADAATTLLTAAPGTAAPPRNGAAKRQRGRDTTRGDGPIAAPLGTASSAIAAAGGIAAGSGSAPAVLTLLLCISAAFLARTLFAFVGLPRPLLRAARLERPG